MAIQVNLSSTQYGMPAPEAYVRVMSFSGDKKYMMAMVAIYYNIAYAGSGARPIDQKPYQFPTEQINGAIGESSILTGIYNYLKSLPEFAGSIDC